MTWAKELGAHVVGTETAYPRLNWELRKQWKPFMMDSILRGVEEAVRVDMPLAIEPVCWHPLENLETTMEVLEKVGDAAHLRIIFDASNLLKHPEKTFQGAYWTQWLEAVGDFVDVMHIKDFSLDGRKIYQPEALGAGVMDYTAISRWLEKQKREIYLLREEMNLPAWAVGFRSFQKALLSALCTPYAELRRLQEENRMTELMVMQENLKMYPLGEVWEEYCRRCQVAVDSQMFEEIEKYEKDVLSVRK